MSRPASDAGIEFDHVWKKFRMGERHDSLRDLLPAVTRRLMGQAPAKNQLRENDFWALTDVSFQVRPGDTLGIIGRNGAGKSTVLKTLTKIIPPTRGRCEVRGRVGALIEVSAGFHQDLTGRENVFLQGAIMGMPKALITRKFDEILAFSGIEQFIDTPVKRYSSGMNARLGFSIAAHLDPDVLIIDEVLAVGDFEFQHRAFERVHKLATSGIPVVVVSHQLDRVAQLCNQAIFLERGKVAYQGSTSECISAYLSKEDHGGDGTSAVHLESMELEGGDSVASGETLTLTLRGSVEGAHATGREVVGIALRNMANGSDISTVSTDMYHLRLPDDGDFTLRFTIQANTQPGLFGIRSFVWDRVHRLELAGGPGSHITVQPGTPFGGSIQLNARVTLDAQPSPALPGGLQAAVPVARNSHG